MPAVVPSPTRPPAVCVSPVCIIACRNVPVAEHHGSGAIDRASPRTRTPTMRELDSACSSVSRSSTTSCRSTRPGCSSTDALDFELIGFFVGLGAGAVHRRTFAAIEQAELDAGGVDRPAHRAAQGVDLADDLSLGHAADGRIAAHLADGVAVGRQQCGLGPQPRRRQCRLGARMSGADHQHVVVVESGHRTIISGKGAGGKGGSCCPQQGYQVRLIGYSSLEANS